MTMRPNDPSHGGPTPTNNDGYPGQGYAGGGQYPKAGKPSQVGSSSRAPCTVSRNSWMDMRSRRLDTDMDSRASTPLANRVRHGQVKRHQRSPTTNCH